MTERGREMTIIYSANEAEECDLQDAIAEVFERLGVTWSGVIASRPTHDGGSVGIGPEHSEREEG